MIPINKKILDLCDERKWSPYELAQRSDVPYATLNSALNRDTAPKIDTLEILCKAFGITLAQFFNDGEQTEVLTEAERELVELYRRLPMEKREAMLVLLKD